MEKEKKRCQGGRTNHYLCSGLLSVNKVLVAVVRRGQTWTIFIATVEEVWISGFQFHDFYRRCNKYTCIETNMFDLKEFNHLLQFGMFSLEKKDVLL